MLSLPLLGQLEDDEWYYGFKAGASYSSIDEIATSLIRPIYPEDTYNTNLEAQIGFAGGFFVHHRFRNSRFAIQPELNYLDQGGIFNYDDVNGLEYKINFQYNYLSLAPMIKIYPVGGLHLAVGPQVGFNLSTSNLKYTSNMPDIGPDLQIQQSLREVLKGSNNVSFVAGIGYDFPFGLSVDARYSYGTSDVIETLANGFYFIENKNRNTTISATIGYAIRFFSN